MAVKELFIQKLEALLPDEQEKVIEFIEFLEFSRKAKVQNKEKAVLPLGKRLREIRAEIIIAGEPLLTPEEVDHEKAERRGGYQGD